MDFTYFLGTSVGALNAAMLGQARNRAELADDLARLKKVWLDIKGNQSIFRPNPWKYLRLFFRDAMYEPVGLQRLIKENIDLDRLFDAASVVKVTAVALETGELLVADSRQKQYKDDFLAYILASASMPLFFPPVLIQGKHWYDGGLRDITPLGSAFAEFPDEIVVILTHPIHPDLSPIIRPAKAGGALDAIWRVIEILTNEISANDLQLANLINCNYPMIPGKRRIPMRIIHPDCPLVGEPMQFSPKLIREQMKMGYQAARRPWVMSGKRKNRLDS